ncbi:hypothetical protein [Streptomyces sp. NPDC093223]|uniref:hypothetical protein n=1 Tax=Streptomyces sp. NPDC093223 TaxID=3366033 RepID=UPI00382D3186
MTTLHIPDPIPFPRVAELCAQFDLDPKRVESLEFRPFGLYVTFLVADDEGRRLSDGHDAAKHRVFVPYLREGASDDDRPPGQR